MTLVADLAKAPWLRGGPVARLFELLDCDGEEARVIGGAVRDALIGKPVGEIDIATTALPEEIVRRAERANIRSIPTGIDHGTVTLLLQGETFEITTLREDVETFGRKARVEFGRNWEHDAQRRDFTINALSVSRDGKVHDYTGGLADLAARRVRFIGDASVRIAEDYLRIMRFFRFHAVFGEGAPDPAALEACIAGREGMDTLSRERVRSELLKLLVAPGAAQVAEIMTDAGLLVRILGGVPLVHSLSRMAAIERELGYEPDSIRRLGAIGVLVAEDAERLFQRLRLSNAEFERLSSMADGWWRVTREMARRDARAMLYRTSVQTFTDRVCLAFSRAQVSGADAAWQSLSRFPYDWVVPELPVSAADFIALGLAKGPALGAALRKAEEDWIRADFPSDASAITQIIRRVASSLPEK